jgi:hypothetical protein
MRIAACVVAILGVTVLASAPAEFATIEPATWNVNNLHFVVGEPLRSNAPPGPKQTKVVRRV